MVWKIIKLGRDIVLTIENKSLGPFELVGTILSVVFIRSLLEIFSNTGMIAHPSVFLVQFPVWYMTVFVGLTIVISLSLQRDTIKVVKVIVAFAFITLIPPVVDLLFYRRGGMNYIFTLKDINKPLTEPLKIYITFFFNINRLPQGVSPGIMVEAYFIVVLVFIYGMLFKKGILRSFIASFLSYSLIYFFAIIPYIVGKLELWLKASGIISPYSALNIEQSCLIFLVLFLFILVIIVKKGALIGYFLSIRFFRLLHYFIVFLFGIYVGIGYNWKNFKALNHGKFFLSFMVILLSAVGAAIFNDITDFHSDRINKRNSPFVRGILGKSELGLISGVAFVLSFLCGLVVSYPLLYFGFVLFALSFIYSSPPVRFKRFPILQTVVLGMISVVSALVGYMYTDEYFPHNILDFPENYMLALLILVAVGGNIKDFGDEKGDKEGGILTIPVLLGESFARFLLGLCVTILFGLIPTFLHFGAIYIALGWIMGFLSLIMLVKRFSPDIVFALYYIYFLLVLFSGKIR
ncbi:MAG: UbiA family prenyltransferase [bacterium]